jgi:hypothetical protein
VPHPTRGARQNRGALRRHTTLFVFARTLKEKKKRNDPAVRRMKRRNRREVRKKALEKRVDGVIK